MIYEYSVSVTSETFAWKFAKEVILPNDDDVLDVLSKHITFINLLEIPEVL